MNGIQHSAVRSSVGEKLWIDNEYTISSLPTYLKGASWLFQVPSWIDQYATISITSPKPATLFIATNDITFIRNQKNQGFDNFKGTVSYNRGPEADKGSFTIIFAKSLSANQPFQFRTQNAGLNNLAIFLSLGIF